jgi:hypothetical protein
MSRLTRIVLPATVAFTATAAVVPALATSAPTQRSIPGRAMIAPLAGQGPRTAAAIRFAAQNCVRFATMAGWPNNGYYGGDLVTAAAICVAESKGDPKLITCDPGLQSGDSPGFTCPGGTTSEDRGLWQLNNGVADPATDLCAFNPVCNADFAYYTGDSSDPASLRGLDFAPWASYDTAEYNVFIDTVQAAVTRLSGGTVTSALLGECLVPAKSKVNSNVVIANCGTGAIVQLWSVGGDRLRSGSVCAAIGSAGSDPGVVLRRCASNPRQLWVAYGRDELRNAADGKCLTDPGSSLTAGTQVVVTACVNAKDQTWWLP